MTHRFNPLMLAVAVVAAISLAISMLVISVEAAPQEQPPIQSPAAKPSKTKAAQKKTVKKVAKAKAKSATKKKSTAKSYIKKRMSTFKYKGCSYKLYSIKKLTVSGNKVKYSIVARPYETIDQFTFGKQTYYGDKNTFTGTIKLKSKKSGYKVSSKTLKLAS